MVTARRALTLALLAVACVPEVGDPPSVVARPRVLGVRFEPAEARPTESFRATALVVDEHGAIEGAEIDWAACVAPKRLVDPGSVTTLCLDDIWAIPFATGEAVETIVPDYACANLGPESAPGEFRPPDPDRTGGYYLPVRAEIEDEVAFGMLRLRCAWANVPVDAVRVLEERWRPNQNPGPFALHVEAKGEGRADLVVRIGSYAAEDYSLYEASEDRVVTRREELVASFFAVGAEVTPSRVVVDPAAAADGTLSARATARAKDDRALAAASYWVVVRDDRGGVAWNGASLE